MSDIIIVEVMGEAPIIVVEGEPTIIEQTVALDGLKGDKGDTGATGAQGVPGATGATGATGAPGVGVPVGGSTAQVLRKKSATDYDTEWATAGAGDMTKAVYDTNNDGKVNAADAADSVPWTGVSGKPTTFPPAPHVHPISDVTGLQLALDGKAALVHTHAIADVTGLQTALNGKVTGNTAITAATKTKVTYDAKGLVTAGADATTADIADSTNRRYVSDAQKVVIGNTSGTNTGDNATNTQYSGLAASKEDTANKQTDLTASATKFPTVNAVNAGLATKQKTITSGTAAPTGGVDGDIYLQYI